MRIRFGKTGVIPVQRNLDTHKFLEAKVKLLPGLAFRMCAEWALVRLVI
jgi:hypothetical protein